MFDLTGLVKNFVSYVSSGAVISCHAEVARMSKVKDRTNSVFTNMCSLKLSKEGHKKISKSFKKYFKL